MIIIKKSNLRQTSFGCPSQWEGETNDGKEVYIRIRHGYFRLEIDNETKLDGYPKGFDGVMSTEEMQEYVNSKNNIIAII